MNEKQARDEQIIERQILEEQALTSKVTAGHRADLVAELVDDHVNSERRKIEGVIFLKLDQGAPLSPAEALQAWIQLHALRNLERTLARKKRDGENAAKRLTRDHAPDGSGDPDRDPHKNRFPHA